MVCRVWGVSGGVEEGAPYIVAGGGTALHPTTAPPPLLHHLVKLIRFNLITLECVQSLGVPKQRKGWFLLEDDTQFAITLNSYSGVSDGTSCLEGEMSSPEARYAARNWPQCTASISCLYSSRTSAQTPVFRLLLLGVWESGSLGVFLPVAFCHKL